MSFTCLSWHTTGATFHYAKRVQKCALNGRFWSFLPFLAVFSRFWPFLKKKMSEIMSYTCLPWPTTGATLHSVRIMQKCAQNVQKCAKKSFFGQILAKKRIFDAPKHVLYDFLHAISIIFKRVKKNVSIALSNYTRNRCDRGIYGYNILYGVYIGYIWVTYGYIWVYMEVNMGIYGYIKLMHGYIWVYIGMKAPLQLIFG